MGVVLLSHVCNSDILYILCYLVICKCGFRFCLCALLSQSHVCWVIYTQLMHVDTGIVEYTFITYYIYSILGFNIWIFFSNSTTKFSRWPPLLRLLIYYISPYSLLCLLLCEWSLFAASLVYTRYWFMLCCGSALYIAFLCLMVFSYNYLAGVTLPIGILISLLHLVIYFIIVFLWSF